MDLIIGGAYQGKLDYAKRRYALSENDIFNCAETNPIDFSKRCINSLEEYTLYCVKNGADAIAEFERRRSEWSESVIICRDIFCGVVPMGTDMREWREATGRLCGYLAREAESVTRMFCGLEQKLK